MDKDNLISIMQQAIVLTLKLSLSPIVFATIFAILISLLQAATQIQDQTLPFLIKLCVVFAVLLVMGQWMGHELYIFFLSLISYIAMI